MRGRRSRYVLIYARRLSAQEHELLSQIVAQPDLPRYIRLRLLIVTLSSQGMPVPEIARKLNVSTATVRKWLHTFNNDGLYQLLAPKHGGGPRRKFGLPDEVAIERIAATDPRDLGLPLASWSLRKLRAYLIETGTVPAISREKLRQIVRSRARSRDCRRRT